MITPDDVRKVASLARIYLREEEVRHLTKDLEKILDYIGKLEKLNIADIEPTSHVLPLKNVYREDRLQEPLSQKEALQLAVEKHAGCFKVPKVIE